MQLKFESKFKELSRVRIPKFSNTRVMMMPIILGDLNSIPKSLSHYLDTFKDLFELTNKDHFGKVGYITIDEKEVNSNETHRRSGLHVDGVFNDSCGSWGGGGGWGSVGNGMITVSSYPACKAYNQEFDGTIGKDGECDLLTDQLDESKSKVFEANRAYWVDGLCVHESLPLKERTKRAFIRLSMPSNAPWFEGYTKNPKGIKPSGEILSKREFQKEDEIVLKD